MTRIDQRFSELSHRMNDLTVPGRSGAVAPSIASLLDKVNAAKLRYQPGARQAAFDRRAMAMPAMASNAPRMASMDQR